MTINDHIKIYSLQEEFNSIFPYLKLEFLFNNASLLNTNHKTLGEFKIFQDSNHVNITPNMTVSDLVNQFKEIYGLQIELYRKSGKVWLETTLTEGWTLEEQNKQGEALSKKVV